MASAKHPHKWGALLACRARLVDGGVAEITLPDGAVVRTDDPGVDATVSKAIGRDVHVASTAPDDRAFEEVWPADVDGLAPEELIEATTVGTDEDGERVSQLPLGLAAPAGTFFDLALLRVITTATLEHLRALDPGATFDVRRYRPNLLVETDDEPGFVENDWPGRTLVLGTDARATVTMPTMRCVMTTLPQEDLPRDRATLRAIAGHNRVDIPGFGVWACAGAYADVAAPGTIRVGDTVDIA